MDYKTDYVWQAALSPMKIWKHDGSDEVFIYRAEDGASAYLKRDDAQNLFASFSAMRASSDPRNVEKASTSTFMSRAMTTTRATRIVSQVQCNEVARLFSGQAMRKTLEGLDVLPSTGALRAESGTSVSPGSTPTQEILGLCLFDPSMRNLLFNMADRYRNVAQIRLTLVSKDRNHAPPRDPTVVINGTPLRDGDRGTRVYADHPVLSEVLAWVDIGAPLSVHLAAPGFLQAVVTLQLTQDRPNAKIALVPIPHEAEKAAKAKAAADKAAKAADARAAAVAKANDAARAEAARKRAEARIAEAKADEMAQAEAKRTNAARIEANTRVANGQPAPTPQAPVIIPPAPEPIDEGGDVAIGDVPAGDVTATTPSVPVPAVVAGPDAEPPATVESSVDESTEAEGVTVSVAGADPAPSPKATGMSGQAATQDGKATGVWLGERLVVSASWTDPGPTEARDDCDPNATDPFNRCEVTPATGNGASVMITSPTDEEDTPARPIPDQTVTYIWQGSEGVRFDPPTSTNGSTSARFERPGEAKVWAQIQRGGRTIAESTMTIYTVGLPSFSLRFDPPGGARSGEEITAQVVISPPLDADLFSLRWLEPATSNRLHTDATGATIRFTGVAGTPVVFDAQVVTAYWGDTIGTISGQYDLTAGSVRVTATARGPAPQVWDAKAGGLVDLPASRWVTGQEITLQAVLEGPPPVDIPRWDWTVNDGTTIYNDIAQSPTVTRSEPGAIEAKVVARDKEGRDIASGSISLSVAPMIAAMMQSDQAVTVLPPPAAPARLPTAVVPPPPPPPPPPADLPGIAPAPIVAVPPPPAPSAKPQPAAPAPAPAPATSMPRLPPPPPVAGLPRAPDPSSDPCAIGTARRQQAIRLWEQGLGELRADRTEAALATLDQSLMLCDDPGRAAQVASLRERVTADPCAPGEARYDQALIAWTLGLGQVSSGAVPEGLISLDQSLALCPDAGRTAQVAQLRASLSAVAAAPAPAAPPQPPPAPTIDEVAAAAQGACDPGGSERANSDFLWQEGVQHVEAGDPVGGLAAMELSRSVCPASPERAEVIDALSRQVSSLDFDPDWQPLSTEPSQQPDAAPNSQTDARFRGRIDDVRSLEIVFEVRGGTVEGTVSGQWDGDPVQLAFSGPVGADGFDVPIAGNLTFESYGQTLWPISGHIWGARSGDQMTGGWIVGGEDEQRSGDWSAWAQ